METSAGISVQKPGVLKNYQTNRNVKKTTRDVYLRSLLTEGMTEYIIAKKELRS